MAGTAEIARKLSKRKQGRFQMDGSLEAIEAVRSTREAADRTQSLAPRGMARPHQHARSHVSILFLVVVGLLAGNALTNLSRQSDDRRGTRGPRACGGRSRRHLCLERRRLWIRPSPASSPASFSPTPLPRGWCRRPPSFPAPSGQSRHFSEPTSTRSCIGRRPRHAARACRASPSVPSRPSRPGAARTSRRCMKNGSRPRSPSSALPTQRAKPPARARKPASTVARRIAAEARTVTLAGLGPRRFAATILVWFVLVTMITRPVGAAGAVHGARRARRCRGATCRSTDREDQLGDMARAVLVFRDNLNVTRSLADRALDGARHTAAATTQASAVDRPDRRRRHHPAVRAARLRRVALRQRRGDPPGRAQHAGRARPRERREAAARRQRRSASAA